MSAALTWILSLGLGLGLLEMTRAGSMFALNALIAVAISVNLAAMALRDIGERSGSIHVGVQRAVTVIWLLALVWAWLAIASLFLASGVLTFAENSARVGGCIGAALLSASFAVLLERARRAHVNRARRRRLLQFARLMAAMQIMVAFALVVMLLSSGVLAGIRADWAANNVLFFGAIALGAVASQAVSTLSDALGEG